jgi:thiamine biosynthesis lipoprotein
MTAVNAAAARDAFGVFGTTATILVTEAAALTTARRIADAALAAVDLACSRFRADSELSVLNAAEGAAAGISELFAELIGAALRAARLTDGAVDPTCGRALTNLGYDRDFALVKAGEAVASGAVARPVPGWRSVLLDLDPPRVQLAGGAQLDLGATAKAWAADHCAEIIARQLGCGVLVSLGGDIAVAGPGPRGGWQVRVTDDHAAGPDAPGQTVAISSGGLATSSTTVRAWTLNGRRMHHIIDPATGEPARSCWRTVSVAAGNCADANTASTAAIVRGAGAVAWLRELALPARLVRENGLVETTAGWPRSPGAEPSPAAAPVPGT